jgi:hypothetical protein
MNSNASRVACALRGKSYQLRNVEVKGMSTGEPDDAGRLTSWTLGAIKERNLILEGYCQTEGCGRLYVFNIDNLIASAGPTYVVPEILPGIECAECGGALKFKLAMMPPEQRDDFER